MKYRIVNKKAIKRRRQQKRRLKGNRLTLPIISEILFFCLMLTSAPKAGLAHQNPLLTAPIHTVAVFISSSSDDAFSEDRNTDAFVHYLDYESCTDPMPQWIKWIITRLVAGPELGWLFYWALNSGFHPDCHQDLRKMVYFAHQHYPHYFRDLTYKDIASKAFIKRKTLKDKISKITSPDYGENDSQELSGLFPKF